MIETNEKCIFQEYGCSVQTVDLVADCPLQVVTGDSRSPSLSRAPTPSPTSIASSTSMGQRSSALLRPRISLTWVLRGQQQSNLGPGPNNYSTINGSGGEKSSFFLLFIIFIYCHIYFETNIDI